MRWSRFLVFNALGAALWVAVWTSVGYLSGSHIGKSTAALGVRAVCRVTTRPLCGHATAGGRTSVMKAAEAAITPARVLGLSGREIQVKF